MFIYLKGRVSQRGGRKEVRKCGEREKEKEREVGRERGRGRENVNLPFVGSPSSPGLDQAEARIQEK